MQEHGLDAWVGATPTTGDQRRQLAAAARTIEARFTRPEQADDRDCALSAAVQVVLGETDAARIVEAWHEARRVEREAHAAMTGALIASAPGVAETALAVRFRLHRGTVRKALGKG